MRRGYFRGFTAAEKTELWDGWQGGELLKAIGERLVNRHRRFIFSWRRTGNSSCATTPLKVGIDAGRFCREFVANGSGECRILFKGPRCASLRLVYLQ